VILLDSRAGSSDLAPYLRAVSAEFILTSLEFGDMAWTGEWKEGATVDIGVEYKKIHDLLACIGDGRFAGHQLPGLIQSYDRIYLVIEGRVRADRNTGILQTLRRDRWYDIVKGGRGFTFRDLEHWYTSMEEFAQVRVVKTYDEYESARWIAAKHTWWTAKGYDEHKSLKQFHVPPPPTATFSKPGVVRRVAKEIVDIGWDRSIPVAAAFRSIRRMANASAEDWAAIKVGEDRNGHKITIGKNRAAKIVEEITREEG
jgi:ERCC4-type nuclease